MCSEERNPGPGFRISAVNPGLNLRELAAPVYPNPGAGVREYRRGEERRTKVGVGEGGAMEGGRQRRREDR